VNATRSLTFLWSSWSVAASALVILAAAALCFAAWRRSGYRRDYGAVELLRLVIVVLAVVLFNQPEWVEQYRPEEKPTIAVLWDGSRSMETADIAGGDDEESDSDAPARITRQESIAPLKEQTFWKSLEDRLAVVIQPIASDTAAKGTNLFDPLAQAPQKFQNLRAIVLASDGDWNDGKPPVEAASALRLRDVPVFAVPVGSPSRLPSSPTRHGAASRPTPASIRARSSRSLTSALSRRTEVRICWVYSACSSLSSPASSSSSV